MAQPPDPWDLDVKLETLTQAGLRVEGGQRNPFQFYVPPPRPYAAAVILTPVPPSEPVTPPRPVEPAAPPPITLRFIGLLEGVPGEGNVAAFSDCRATMRGVEGDIVDGRYRLARIAIESVVMEYPDGSGRTTIRKSGQECVGK